MTTETLRSASGVSGRSPHLRSLWHVRATTHAVATTRESRTVRVQHARYRIRVAGSTLFVLAAACENAEVPALPAVRRDSAGIEIVESSAPQWRDHQRWRVSDSPITVIGQEGAGLAYEFAYLRGGTRLPNGNVVALDGGSAHVHYYDLAGRHIRTVGGKGGGPGEFAHPMYLRQLSGGQLQVWDLGLGPITVFDSAGTYLGRTHFDRTPLMGA
jgi:hypothetical protein